MPQQVVGPLTTQEYAKHAGELLQQFGGYYPAAKKLGDPNLRAGLWLLLKNNRPPSPRLQKALERWANIETVIIEVPPGSPVFGATGALLDLGQVVAILVMLPQEWERHSITCAACGERTPRWSPNQRYCPAHSWTTPEGRRWHRQQQRKKE